MNPIELLEAVHSAGPTWIVDIDDHRWLVTGNWMARVPSPRYDGTFFASPKIAPPATKVAKKLDGFATHDRDVLSRVRTLDGVSIDTIPCPGWPTDRAAMFVRNDGKRTVVDNGLLSCIERWHRGEPTQQDRTDPLLWWDGDELVAALMPLKPDCEIR